MDDIRKLEEETKRELDERLEKLGMAPRTQEPEGSVKSTPF